MKTTDFGETSEPLDYSKAEWEAEYSEWLDEMDGDLPPTPEELLGADGLIHMGEL